MKAYIYTRVSTVGQAEDGVSLAAQAERGRAWAQHEGLEVGGLFTDEGISGRKSHNRPGLQAALEAVCRSKGTLVVYSLSRLARSVQDAIAICERLRRAGAELVSLTEKIDTSSASGKLLFTILAAVAQFDSDVTSERTRAALAYKRSKGQRTGTIPFGSRLAADGESLEVDPTEARTRAAIHARRNGGETWEQVAAGLNASGARTKLGRTWTWQTARKAAGGAATLQ